LLPTEVLPTELLRFCVELFPREVEPVIARQLKRVLLPRLTLSLPVAMFCDKSPIETLLSLVPPLLIETELLPELLQSISVPSKVLFEEMTVESMPHVELIPNIVPLLTVKER
jgi:hypothetical protein